MGDVKPWEPVSFGWTTFDSFPWGIRTDADRIMADVMLIPEGMRVTLANKQKIIVRALSEERKAARRARQEANR